MNDFDLISFFPWITGGLLVFFFAVCVVFVAQEGEKRMSLPVFQFLLVQLVFVPVLALVTLWCYQHPERLDNDPEALFSDMRWAWPWLAALDVLLIAAFVRARWWTPGARALRLMKRAQRLLAEGRLQEADAAYAKGRWILDHKCR
jgi:hypothetical protein